MKQCSFYLALFFAIFTLLSGCSGASQEKSEMSTSKMAEDKGAGLQNSIGDAKTEKSEQKQGKGVQSNRKLIKTAELQLETTIFDASLQKLESLSKKFGGYIESNQVTGASMEEKDSKRTASYTVRIPADQLDAYLAEAGDIGNILSKTMGTDDVTDQYFDTEARVNSLKVQEERLLALLKQAGSLKDMLEIEKELATVRYEIENLTTTLKKYDGLVAYSTVHVTLNEVATITDTSNPKTTGERIAHQFKDNITAITNGAKGLLVFLIGNSPVLLLLAAVGAAGYLISRRLLKQRANKNINS